MGSTTGSFVPVDATAAFDSGQALCHPKPQRGDEKPDFPCTKSCVFLPGAHYAGHSLSKGTIEMAGKSLAETGVDVTSRFEQELQSRADDLYREAALAMLTKASSSNKVTVEEFLSALEQHKDVWSAVSRMGVIEFMMALGGRGGGPEDESKSPFRRDRHKQAHAAGVSRRRTRSRS